MTARYAVARKRRAPILRDHLTLRKVPSHVRTRRYGKMILSNCYGGFRTANSFGRHMVIGISDD